MFLILLGVPRAARFNIWSPNVAEFSNPDFTRTELRRTKTNSDFNQDFCRVGKWRWSKNLDVFVSVRVKDRPQFCVRRLERGADANAAGSTIHYGIAMRWTLALKIVFSRSWDTGPLYLSPPAPPRHQGQASHGASTRYQATAGWAFADFDARILWHKFCMTD